MVLETERRVYLHPKELGLRYWPHYIIKEKYTQVFIKFFALSAENDKVGFISIEFDPPLAAPTFYVIHSFLHFPDSQQFILALSAYCYVIRKLELACSSLIPCG